MFGMRENSGLARFQWWDSQTYHRELWNLLLVGVVFLWGLSILRIEFVLWNFRQAQQYSFSDLLQAWFLGWRLDFSSLSFLISPFFLLALVPLPRGLKFLNWIGFVSFCGLALASLILGMIDIEFVNFIGRRLTRSDEFLFREMSDKAGSVVLSYLPFFLLNVSILVVVSLLWWILKSRSQVPSRWWGWRMAGVWTIATIVFFLGARGGFQPKPIGLAHASQFSSSFLNNMAAPTSFLFLKSFDQDFVPKYRYFTQDRQVLAYLNESLPGASVLPSNVITSQPMNVVILIVESLSSEYTGLSNAQGPSYTPFLDELSQKSLNFTESFANGRRSIEALSSIVAGIPALYPEPIIGSPFQQNDFDTLAHQLRRRGYWTGYFHGGNNGTMLFDQFTAKVGIDHYFGTNEYPGPQTDHDGTWGIFDEPFLKFMASELERQETPFFATFFSLTSHNPYKIPSSMIGKFAKGTLPIHESIGYADWSLRQFFEKNREKEWFKNTLFVITGDHTSLLANPLVHEQDAFRVPILFYRSQGFDVPNLDLKHPVQHIDIPVSVMDVLGFDMQPSYLMGRSVFRSGPRSVVLRLAQSFLLVSQSGEAKVSAFDTMDFSNGNAVTPMAAGEPMNEELVQRLRASVQYYSSGLFRNDLYFRKVLGE